MNSDLPYPGWHCVQIVGEADGGWGVECIPHGHVGGGATHLKAMIAAVQHDIDNGTYTGN